MRSRGGVWEPPWPCSRHGAEEAGQRRKYICRCWHGCGREDAGVLDTVQAARCGSAASGQLAARLAAQSLPSSPPWLPNDYLASDQSLYLCASVSLNMAGDGDAEGKDRNTQAVKDVYYKKGVSWEGVTSMGTTGHPHQLSSILGLGASKVYKTTNDPEMALETQRLTGRQSWSLSGHSLYSSGWGDPASWQGGGGALGGLTVPREVLAGLSLSPLAFLLVCLGLTCIFEPFHFSTEMETWPATRSGRARGVAGLRPSLR